LVRVTCNENCGYDSDIRMVIRFTVFGIPRTKKTHNVLARAGSRLVILPNKKWTEWVERAYMVWPRGRTDLQDVPYNICALFYRDANRGDAVGYYQGLADLLEKRGIISNDKWLVSWDGSRLLKDKGNPRVEITLTAVEKS